MINNREPLSPIKPLISHSNTWKSSISKYTRRTNPSFVKSSMGNAVTRIILIVWPKRIGHTFNQHRTSKTRLAQCLTSSLPARHSMSFWTLTKVKNPTFELSIKASDETVATLQRYSHSNGKERSVAFRLDRQSPIVSREIHGRTRCRAIRTHYLVVCQLVIQSKNLLCRRRSTDFLSWYTQHASLAAEIRFTYGSKMKIRGIIYSSWFPSRLLMHFNWVSVTTDRDLSLLDSSCSPSGWLVYYYYRCLLRD